jgi:hypothetical protein
MNDLQEFFKQAALEKKKSVEKKKKQEMWEKRLTPQVNFLSEDLNGFFGAVNSARKEHILVERVITEKAADVEKSKVNALQLFFNKLNSFETALTEAVKKQDEPKVVEKEDKKVEEFIKEIANNTPHEEQFDEVEVKPVQEDYIEPVKIPKSNYFSKNIPEPKQEDVDITKLVNAMSAITRPQDKVPGNKLNELQRLAEEFRQFKNIVTRQMASIGGGGETRLLNLDDVDTSTLGNGKFLVYNSTSGKLEFTDQVDGN